VGALFIFEGPIAREMAAELWSFQSFLDGEDQKDRDVQKAYSALFRNYNSYKFTHPSLRHASVENIINEELDKYKKNSPEHIRCPMPGRGLSYSPRMLHYANKGSLSDKSRTDGCLIIDRPFAIPFLVPIPVDNQTVMDSIGKLRTIHVGGDNIVFVRVGGGYSESGYSEITLSTGEIKPAEKYWWCEFPRVVMRPSSTNEVYASNWWFIAVGKIRAFEPTQLISVISAVLPFLEDEKVYKARIKHEFGKPTGLPRTVRGRMACQELLKSVADKGHKNLSIAINTGNCHTDTAVFFGVLAPRQMEPKGSELLYSLNLLTGSVVPHPGIYTTGANSHSYCGGKLITRAQNHIHVNTFDCSPPPELIPCENGSLICFSALMLTSSNEFAYVPPTSTVPTPTFRSEGLRAKCLANIIYDSEIRIFLPPTRAEIEQMTHWLMANSGVDWALPLVVWQLIAVMLSDV
jgi:hypothetical protein